MSEHVIIVGGGLSGLTLAYLLSKQTIEATILEASPRIGGRIQTAQGKLDTPLELGATWLSDLHPHLLALLDELDLKKYPQFSKGKSLFQTKSFEPPQEFEVPESDEPSYRIKDGTEALIQALASKLDQNNIFLNHKVSSVTERNDELIIESTTKEKFIADKVILCLPSTANT